ncbi:short-chain dehydrogenase [Mycena metata]|uniref:Short-chain dehydrogenase n=1 Tax=Mycena metata TaxID=1033252 RepID=A0AAD7M9W2_9AGAR|nr:short-chain dehydrogenase [Mycena metata]
MRFSYLSFIRSQCAERPPVVKVDLTGQTVIVVGANAGLGFEATKHFATMNPGRLILACRDQKRGQAAVDKLQAETGYETAELWIVDLADFTSVKRFADKFEQDGGRLDILVANAAVILPKYEATKDGWETCLQVNCLAMPLLSLLLLPHMVRTGERYGTLPRLVVVASGVHHWGTIEKPVLKSNSILATLGSAEYCTPKVMGERYFLTKLLNVMFVRALNARISASTPLVVNAVDPGYCYSGIRNGLSGMQVVADYFMEKTLALPTEVGCRQLVWAATGEQDTPDKLRGEYISMQQVEEVSDYVLSAEGMKTQDRIWGELVEILKAVDPRVSSTVNDLLV